MIFTLLTAAVVVAVAENEQVDSAIELESPTVEPCSNSSAVADHHDSQLRLCALIVVLL